MNETISELRTRFECHMDIKIEPSSGDWKSYALWLEELAIHQLNTEILKENLKLRHAYEQVADILDQAITEPV